MATVKSLLVRIGLDAAEYQRGMTDAQKKMTEFGQKLKESGMALTKAITVPIVGVGIAAFKTSIDFNKAMANIATLIPGNVKRLAELKRGIQDLAISTGKSTADIAEGCYHVISAFGDTADTMGILEISAKAATAGISTTRDALELTSVIMKNFGEISEEASMLVMDLAFGAVKLGQCVTGDTRIILSDGSYKRIDELEGGGRVIAYDGRGFVPMQARWIDQGTKPTVTLRTRLGREVTTTWNHPYLTKVQTRDRRSTKDPEWKKVSDLKIGDKIAIPTSIPFFGSKKVSKEDAAILGLWLAEGACKSSSPRISSTRYGDEIKALALKKGCSAKNVEKRRGKCPVWEVTANAKGHPNGNPIQAFLRKIGLGECSSATKHIPEEVFTWDREGLAIFLRWLFNGDGWLYTKKRGKNGLGYQLGFVSKSERLVRDVSHLLLRFGIIGRVRERENKWCWETQRNFEIARFLDFIGIDRLGADVFRKYKPPCQIKPFGVVEFDAILSIEKGKPRHVYDLTVRELHNFIANDIVAHNTTFPELASAIQGVASMAKTLNMSQEELFTTYATFTGVTGDATRASTQLRAIMNALLKATPELTTAMDLLGYSSAQTMVEEMGLFGAVRKLIGTTDGLAESVSELFPNIRGIGLVLASSGAQAGTFEEKLAKIKVMCGGMLEAYKEQTEGINAVGFAWSVFKTLAVVVTQTLGDALKPAFEAVFKVMIPIVELVRKLVGWFGSLPGPIKIAVAGLAVAAAALGPLLVMIGAVITMLPLLGTAFATLTGPIGLIYLAIVGLAIAGAIVVSEWDKIKAFFKKLWSGISGFFDTTIGKILAVCFPFIGLPVMIAKHWDKVKVFFSGLWRAISEEFTLWCDFIKDLMIGVWADISGFFKSVFNIIKGIVSGSLKAITGVFSGFFNWLKKIAPAVLSDVANFIINILLGLMKQIAKIPIIKRFVKNLEEGLAAAKAAVATAKDKIAESSEKMAEETEEASEKIAIAYDRIGKKASEMKEKLVSMHDATTDALMKATRTEYEYAKWAAQKKYEERKAGLEKEFAEGKAGMEKIYEVRRAALEKEVKKGKESKDELLRFDKYYVAERKTLEKVLGGELLLLKKVYTADIEAIEKAHKEKVASLRQSLSDQVKRADMDEYESAKLTAQRKYEATVAEIMNTIAAGKERDATLLDAGKILQNELTAIEEGAAKDREEKRREAIEKYLDVRRSLTDAINQMVMGEREYALTKIEQEYEDTVKYAKKLKDDKVISAEEANDMIADAGDKRRLSEEEAERAHAQKVMDGFFAVGQAVSNLFSQIGALAQTNFNNQLAMLDKETEARRENLEEQYEAEKERIENSLMSEEEKDEAIEKLEEEKNEAIEKLDESSEKKKKAIQKKAFESQKKISLVTAAISIAEAVAKALTGAIPPFNFILAGLVVAAGAVQMAAIAAQKFPSAKEGAWVPSPTLVEAGHGPEGELILPVHKLRAMFAEAMETRAETAPVPIRIYLDHKTFIGSERFKQSILKVVNDLGESRELKIPSVCVVP